MKSLADSVNEWGMLGIHISPVGKISVYSDSKGRTEAERLSTEKQLKAGRLYGR